MKTEVAKGKASMLITRTCISLVIVLIFGFTPLFGSESERQLFFTELNDTFGIQELVELGPVVYWYAETWVLTDRALCHQSLPIMDLSSISNQSKSLFLIHATTDINALERDLLSENEIFLVRPGLFLGMLNETERDRLLMRDYRLNYIPNIPHAMNNASESRVAYDAVQWSESIQSLVNGVSVQNALGTINNLVSFVTRFSNTQGARNAADWIANEFRSMGYGTYFQDHTGNMAPNVIAEKQGLTYPNEIIIMCAHYDSTSRIAATLAPGADDNASGVAAVIESARVISSRSTDRTIRWIAFSGEEQGLYGSHAHAASAAAAGEQIVAVFNADMIGWASPYPEDLDCVVNPSSSSLGDYVVDCASIFTGLSIRKHVDASLTYSDHASFWQYGYPALLGIEDIPIEYPYYHTIDDTAEKIDETLLGMTTQLMVATMASLAGVQSDSGYPDDLGVELIMEDTDLEAGDHFRLGLTYWNDDPVAWVLPLYLVLDAYGSYFFWPAWETDIDFSVIQFDSQSIVRDIDIIEFDWPENVGHASGLHFWAGIMNEENSEVIGESNMIQWQYRD